MLELPWKFTLLFLKFNYPVGQAWLGEKRLGRGLDQVCGEIKHLQAETKHS